jgi:hypothetical protein
MHSLDSLLRIAAFLGYLAASAQTEDSIEVVL